MAVGAEDHGTAVRQIREMSWAWKTALCWLLGWLLSGTVLFAQGPGTDEQRLQRAAQLFEEGLRHQTGDTEPPDLKRALDYYSKALQVYPQHYPDPVPILYNAGLIYFQFENFQRAQGLFLKAARAARELSNKRRGDEAKQVAAEYEGLARNGYGSCLQKDGKLSEAEQQFRSAALLYPQLVEAHFNLINLLVKEERWPEAEKAIAVAEELAPSSHYGIFKGRQKGKEGREGIKGFGGLTGILIVLGALCGYYFFMRLRKRG